MAGTSIRAAVLALLSMSCGAPPAASDAAIDAGRTGTHGEMAWRLRCLSSPCTTTDHAVSGYHGDDRQGIRCRVVETPTTRALTLDLSGEGFGLQLMSGELPREGGSGSGDGCGVAVFEGSALVTASGCGTSPPSPTQRCALAVSFGVDAEGSRVEGEMRCVALVGFGETRPAADFTGPGEGAAAEMSAARFVFHDCEGYVP